MSAGRWKQVIPGNAGLQIKRPDRRGGMAAFPRGKKVFYLRKEKRTMLEKIKEIVAESLNVDAAELTEETNFKDDLGADSLDLFEMVMAFEEEFEVEIPSEDLEQIATVGDVGKYREAHK